MTHRINVVGISSEREKSKTRFKVASSDASMELLQEEKGKREMNLREEGQERRERGERKRELTLLKSSTELT